MSQTDDVTHETLEATPVRLLKLLSGIGRTPEIRAALNAVGYSAEEHARGWSLLHAASGYEHGTPDVGTAADPEVARATAELDAWDEDGFRIVRAALGRSFPAIASEVLEGIGASTGAASVMGVGTLLDRLDSLEKRKDKDAHSAIALLERRGVTKEKRKALRKLVEIAERGTDAQAPDPRTTKQAEAEKAIHQKALLAARAWYLDWSEMARSVIKRRDRLIRIGLASRKVREKNKGNGGPPPAAS